MRNHIPRLKTLKYTKTREEMDDNDDGRITLIKSDNKNFEWEAYHFKTGTFLGYLSPRKQEKREISIAKGDLIDKSDQSRFSQFNLENIE
jgi:hypothetical protein